MAERDTSRNWRSRYYIIPDHPMYSITGLGNVVDRRTEKTVDWTVDKGCIYVTLDGEQCPIAKVLANVFIGNLNLPVFSSTDEQYNARTLQYLVPAGTRYNYFNDRQVLRIQQLDEGVDIEFRVIPRNTRYYISRDGVVFDTKRLLFTHRTASPNGYYCVSLHAKGVRKGDVDNPYNRAAVSRLVYEAWVGPIPDGYDVDHRDNNRLNNDYTNLIAITHAANTRKALRRDGQSIIRYSDDDAITAGKMLMDNAPYADIAKAIGTECDHQFKMWLNHIRFGDTQRDLLKDYDFSNYDGRVNYAGALSLSPKQRKELIWRYKMGDDIDHLSEDYGISKHQIEYWCRGKNENYIKGDRREFTDIIERYRNGESADDLAKEAGVSAARIRYWGRGVRKFSHADSINRIETDANPENRKHRYLNQQMILSEVQMGKSYREIGKTHHMDRETVRDIVTGLYQAGYERGLAALAQDLERKRLEKESEESSTTIERVAQNGLCE